MAKRLGGICLIVLKDLYDSNNGILGNDNGAGSQTNWLIVIKLKTIL
jgi:hypothetical protein